MKQFLLKLTVVLLALVAGDQLLGRWLQHLYFAQKGEEYHFATKAIDRQEAQLLFLGSSRCCNHYNATLIGDSLGLTAYNCGRSGYFMVYQSAQLDLILDRYTPRVVVLDITPYDLDGPDSPAEYDKYSALLPYSHHASYRAILRKRSWYEPLKALSLTYRYNSMLLKLINNSGTADNGGFQPDGHQPVPGTLQGDAAVLKDMGYSGRLSEAKVGELRHIISVCRQRGIRLLCCTSPYYARYGSTPTTLAADSILRAEGIPYRSWLNAPDFLTPDLYFTPDHLNAQGAIRYSSQVAAWMDALLHDSASTEK